VTSLVVRFVLRSVFPGGSEWKRGEIEAREAGMVPWTILHDHEKKLGANFSQLYLRI
jgi:hypothetical protein